MVDVAELRGCIGDSVEEMSSHVHHSPRRDRDVEVPSDVLQFVFDWYD